jgi:sugar lactone lactonase YvrE
LPELTIQTTFRFIQSISRLWDCKGRSARERSKSPSRPAKSNLSRLNNGTPVFLETRLIKSSSDPHRSKSSRGQNNIDVRFIPVFNTNMNPPTSEMRILVSASDEEDRFLPEGPRNVLVDGREALVWVNIQMAADSIHGALRLRFWDTGATRKLPQRARPGFVFPTDRDGCLVVGMEKEIGLLDLRTESWTPWAAIPDANPRTIVNDGEIVPGGRAIVFGTKDVRFTEPIAHLYLFTLDDRRISVLADEQLCSNGKVLRALSGGRCLLFDIDTPKRNVLRYVLDLEKRTLQLDAVQLDLSAIEGFPDGMVDGGDHTFIIAFYNPSRGGPGTAIRFDPAGAIVEEWTTPGSPRVTCPLLVQREGRIQLIVTTAVEGMPAELRQASPAAGNLFIGETSLIKLPAAETVWL